VTDKAGAVIGRTGKFTSRKSGTGMPFRALLTADHSTVWLKVPLAKVPDLDGLAPALFLRLLSANRRISPAYFTYADDECTLYLYLPTNAPALSATGLEAQLEFLVARADETRSLWDCVYWPTQPAPAPARDGPRGRADGITPVRPPGQRTVSD
jgi:hypothetical protein